MISVGLMGLAVIFMIPSALSLLILPIWIFKGPGELQKRKVIGGTSLLIIISCWVIIFTMGTNEIIALTALITGVIVSFASLLLPSFYKWMIMNNDDT